MTVEDEDDNIHEASAVISEESDRGDSTIPDPGAGARFPKKTTNNSKFLAGIKKKTPPLLK